MYSVRRAILTWPLVDKINKVSNNTNPINAVPPIPNVPYLPARPPLCKYPVFHGFIIATKRHKGQQQYCAIILPIVNWGNHQCYPLEAGPRNQHGQRQHLPYGHCRPLCHEGKLSSALGVVIDGLFAPFDVYCDNDGPAFK